MGFGSLRSVKSVKTNSNWSLRSVKSVKPKGNWKPKKCGSVKEVLNFNFPLDLKKTTVVVESLSSNTTKCSVPENISILQDYFNRMRNLHQGNICFG